MAPIPQYRQWRKCRSRTQWSDTDWNDADWDSAEWKTWNNRKETWNKWSTATEHVERNDADWDDAEWNNADWDDAEWKTSYRTATEHVESPCTLTLNAKSQRAIEDAEKDRTDDFFENLAFQLGYFLSHVLVQSLDFTRFCHSMDDAASKEIKENPRDMINSKDCFDIVFDRIGAWLVEGKTCLRCSRAVDAQAHVGCHDAKQIGYAQNANLYLLVQTSCRLQNKHHCHRAR